MEDNTTFTWDEETGIATCTLLNPDSGKYVTGVAKCHPDDRDMMNKITGQNIAFHRALLRLYKEKRSSLRVEKKALQNLYNTFMIMPDFDKDNRYIRVTRHKLYSLEEDINTYCRLINDTWLYLQDYMVTKDKFYKLTRSNREIKQEN